MTYPISDVTRRVVYSGSAGTGPYSFSFEILNQDDIAVYENDTLLTITTDYTVTINADGTGSVTLVSASTASDTVAILGNKGIERQTDFVTGGDLFASSLNDELDAQTIFAQQNAEAVSRAIKIPPQSSLSIDTTLPVPQGNYILGWNDTGDAILNLQEIGSYQGTDATTTTANYNNRDIVKDSSNSNVYICTAASTAGTLLTNTSYWALLVDAVSASSAQTAAETAQTAAEDAQGYAEEWATKAEDSLISTDAGGDGSTDYSSLHHAAKASASASNAATSESNAEDWASKTDGIVDSTDYAAKAWSIGGTGVTDTASAGAAKEWATKAEDSTVDGTEYSAKHYAAKASTSATNAQAALDSIENFYLGASATAPTVDDNGDPLAAGDWYFDTTDNLTYIYNGSSWQATVLDSSGLVATAGDTMTGDLSFGDNNKAVFGAGSDLQIYHSGSESVVLDNGTGGLALRGSTFVALQAASTENMVVANDNGSVQLFYDASEKLATTSTGIDVTGQVVAEAYTETVYNTGTALDPANGGIQYKTLSANTTFTDSLADGESMTLRLEGGATYTVTYPTMTWIGSGGNVAPTLNGTKDTLVFWKENSTLYGAYVGYGA